MRGLPRHSLHQRSTAIRTACGGGRSGGFRLTSLESFVSSAGVVEIVIIVHAGVTCAMAGVILIVQFVHYPLFAAVGEERFVEYETSHARRITWVVAPLMLIELAAAILLVLVRPEPVSAVLLWTGLVLVLIIWISTAAIQVPLHNILVKGFVPVVHRRLLVSNGLRTVCWLARSIIACIIVVQYFGR